MAEPEAIKAALELLLGRPSLAGERVLVTAGGTREPIDAVRAITNRSSGKMGFAVAAQAALRGAEVILIAGPCSQPTPPGVRRVDVETALEMRDAVRAEFGSATVAHAVDAESQRAGHVDVLTVAGDLRLTLRGLADYAGDRVDHGGWIAELRDAESAATAGEVALMEADDQSAIEEIQAPFRPYVDIEVVPVREISGWTAT